MSNGDYRAFLESVFNTYVYPRLRRRAIYYSLSGPGAGEMAFGFEHMRRTAQLLRFIQSFSEDDNDPYSTFQPARLREAVYDVNNALHSNNRLLDETGFLDALDTHYDEIVDGLTVEHFTEQELGIFKDLGSDDPQRDVQALIFILKARRRASIPAERTRVRDQLARVEAQISAEADVIQGDGEIPQNVRKPRRWFKGLGQIAEGIALSLANVGFAIGLLHFSVPPEIQSGATLISVTTGVGKVITGAGDLRGE